MSSFPKLLTRSLQVSLLLVGGYVSILVLMCVPATQRMGLFLHFVNYPFAVDWDLPEKFGFPHNKVKNFNFKTPDGLTLGAWHILPTQYHTIYQLRDQAVVQRAVYDSALKSSEYDTVLYLHGNAGNRASPWRIETYQRFADKFDVNLIAIDYRGFGNSEGFPSEEGLRIDAKAIWDWLRAKGVSNEKIVILGHSLGTGVATRLASDVSLEGTPPKALILEAAYSSIAEVLPEYAFLRGYVPLLKPLKPFPFLKNFILSRLDHFFDSMTNIQTVDSSILIIYGGQDSEIPAVNSHRLFHRAIHGSNTTFALDFLAADSRITKHSVENEGTRYDFPSEKGVALLEVKWAHHNNLPMFDIVWEFLAEKAGLRRECAAAEEAQ